MNKCFTSIKQNSENTTKKLNENITNEQKIHKKNQKIMKLYNKKIHHENKFYLINIYI